MRQEDRLGVDALGGNVFTQNARGPLGYYGVNWASVLDPLRQRFHDGGNFFWGILRGHDEDQEDSSEEEELSVGAACAVAGSKGIAESSSGGGFSEGDSEDADVGEYNSSDTTVNGPCTKMRK